MVTAFSPKVSTRSDTSVRWLPSALRTMGATMLRLVGLFVPEVREMMEMRYQFEKPFVVDGSSFERTFGLRATPLADVVHRTVAWYRTHFGAVEF